MTTHVAFHCCKAAQAAGFPQGFIEPADAVGKKGSARVDMSSPTLAVDALPHDLDTAWHEAGHAVVGEIDGLRLQQVQICHPYVTRWERRSDPMTLRQAIRHTLAGEIAERWRHRHIYRATDEELMFYVRAIRSKASGRCDLCRAFGYVFEVRPDDDDATTLASFRQFEAETIDLVTSRPVTAMIRAAAAQLMLTPVMTGDEVRRIMQRFQLDSGS